MNNQLVISGLPDKLRLDGWWLSNEITDQPDAARGKTSQPDNTRVAKPGSSIVVLAVIMVILADWLFWHQAMGLSVAVFASGMNVIMLLARPRATSGKEWLGVMVVSIMANLPVAEHLHPLSFLFSTLGTVSVAVWLTMDRLVGWGQSIHVFLKLTTIGPFRIFVDLWGTAGTIHSNKGITRLAVSLLLPGSLGLVFIALLVAANPFFEQMINALSDIDMVSFDAIIRMVFWCLILAFVWPYLNLPLFRVKQRTLKQTPTLTSPEKPGLLINASSVTNSLFLFNAIFAAQTGLDLLILSGGMALPEGMSYASYAHRGAYPLVATALLAGAFAIGTRSLIVKNRLMRGLVYLWLLQNLFLVLSAAFRLNLYVETYALTYLRVAAFIWMILVFIGLVLVAFQISRNKGNIWLMAKNSIALILVLYLSCFINFAQIIATYNIAHPLSGGTVDAEYICRLGPHALPAILSKQADQNTRFCPPYTMPVFHSAEGWRDWGFRNWRLQRYLTTEF